MMLPLLFLVAMQAPAAAQEPAGSAPTAGPGTVLARVDALRRNGGIPGMQVVLVVRGKAAESWVFGGGITRESRFNVASVSKLLTATAVVQLADRKKIDLDDPVEPLLRQPWLSRIGLPQVTWRQLLTHTSGLHDVFHTGKMGYGLAWLGEAPGDGDFLPQRLPLGTLLPQLLTKRQEPGRFHYSNDGYALLSYLVGRAGGMPFERYVRVNVLHPLGMRHSAFGRRALGEDVPIAPGHGAPRDGKPDPEAVWPPYEVCTLGNSGLWTTGDDLAKFIVAQFDARGLAGGAVLSRRATRSMRSSIIRTGDGGAQGFGFVSWRDGWVGHEGSNPGYTAELFFHPASENGYAILCNQDRQYRPAESALRRLRELLESELSRRSPAPRPPFR